MKPAVIAAVLFLGLISSATALIFEKKCIIFEESYTFNEDRYTGKWFEIRRLHDPEVPEQEECVQERYTRSTNMMDFDIVRSVQLNASVEPIYSAGSASPRVFASSVVPQFYLRYNTTSPAEPDTAMDIVQTDYLNYAIVYSCNTINTTAVSESAWIISRRPTVSKHVADMINKFVATHFNHPEHKWRVTEQSNEFCKPTAISNGVSRSMLNVSRWQASVYLLTVYLLSKLIL